MKRVIALLSTFAIFLSAVSAQADSFTLTCKSSPSFLTSIRKTLEGMVADQIDQGAFSDGRALIQFKLLSLQTSTDSVTTDELLGGIDIHDSGDPVGLAFGVDGDINLATTGTCVYTYRVVVTTRARDTAGGDRINTRTDSTITITTPPYGVLRHN